jgi:hypothetical protein
MQKVPMGISGMILEAGLVLLALGLAAMGWVLSDMKKNAWIAGALVSAAKS